MFKTELISFIIKMNFLMNRVRLKKMSAFSLSGLAREKIHYEHIYSHFHLVTFWFLSYHARYCVYNKRKRHLHTDDSFICKIKMNIYGRKINNQETTSHFDLHSPNAGKDAGIWMKTEWFMTELWRLIWGCYLCRIWSTITRYMPPIAPPEARTWNCPPWICDLRPTGQCVAVDSV